MRERETERADAFMLPFNHQAYFIPVFLDENYKLPRIPMKEEYFAWAPARKMGNDFVN